MNHSNTFSLSFPEAKTIIVSGDIHGDFNLEGKIIVRLHWYAFDRYEETKGIKLQKMVGHAFPRLG